MSRIQVIAKNVNFPSAAAAAAAAPTPPPPALCDKADCRASRWELKNQEYFIHRNVSRSMILRELTLCELT